MKWIFVCLMSVGLAMAGEHGYLGVVLQSLDDDLKESLAFEGDGVVISHVVEGSAAERAGLKTGDIIVKVDAVPVTQTDDLTTMLKKTLPGDLAELALFRDGDQFKVTVTLGEQKDISFGVPEANKWISLHDGHQPWIGISMQDLNDQLASYFDVSSGILITEVDPESPAHTAGLLAGDVILQFNQEAMSQSVDLKHALAGHEEGDIINLQVVRKGERLGVDVTLGKREYNGTYLYSPDVNKFFNGKDFTFKHDLPFAQNLDLGELREEMEKLKKEMQELRRELNDKP